jgi:cytochrome c-type biogenesis protein CcmF
MIGSIIIRVAFGCALLSAACYYRNHKSPSTRILLIARILFRTAVVGMLSASALLIYLIMTHQFQYAYVWNYSSTDLPKPLLFSTFYAGQEGSFNLWALYTGVIGVLLMRYSSKKGYESELMSVYGLMFSFLLLMLIVKNPFMYIWDKFPDQLLHTGVIPASVTSYVWVNKAEGLWAQIPTEGKGLNPLLQNYWMVIHPPILFLGFTCMSIPFAHAVAGMMKRDYVSWIRAATPWSVFGAMMLGTGIVLGGYWAYETLGWGGYWGWDPVENSSLVPWLFCVASIHSMLSQRKNGSFIKTNFILSMMCYIMVLYSTFLTRSGVLGDTSVHSFVEPGMWVYWLLLVFIATFAVIGFGLFFARMKEMPKVPVEHSIVSREFALFLGSSALVFIAIFVVIGTSAPLITTLLQHKASAVDTKYYITTTLPLGIMVALLAGLGQLLWWQNSKTENILRSLRLPIGEALLLTSFSYIIGAHQPVMLLFIFASSFALFTNLLVGYRIFKGNPRMAGGAIAHIGISLMFLGFVASAKYDYKETISLEQGKPVEAMGYRMTYTGYHPEARGRFAFDVEVEKQDQKFVVEPVMFAPDNNEGFIRNPDIINLLTKDFYVSPLSLETPDEQDATDLTLYKDKPDHYNNYSITYRGYDFSMSPETGNVVKVNLDIESKGRVERLTPTMINKKGQVNFIPAKLEKTDITIALKKMNPNQSDPSQSSVTISIVDPKTEASQQTKNDVLIVEASVKPFINLVWMGTATMIFGFLTTIARRSREARRGQSD